MAAGRAVPADALVTALWDEPPPTATAVLHSYVSRLRRALGAAGPVLERRGGGYRLALPETAFDWCRFEVLADQGQRALDAGDAVQAHELLSAAEALWRGPALDELAGRAGAEGLAARLEERRESVRGSRLEADLRLGRHDAVLGELAQAVRARPLDEARWSRLALARYRSGQQAEALSALAEARRTLVDDLGVEPGQALRALELAVLRQDTALDLPRTPPARGDRAGVPRLRRRWSGATPSWPPCSRRWTTACTAPSSAWSRASPASARPGWSRRSRRRRRAAARSSCGAAATRARARRRSGRGCRCCGRCARSTRSAPRRASPRCSTRAAARRTRPGLFAGLEAVTQAVRRTSAQQPLVVLLDDLQWADAASLELVGYLATHLVDERVLLLATVRDVAAEQRDELVAALAAVARRRGTRRLRLAGLDAAGTADLVQQTATGEVGADVLRAVHERADGNPFFATELTRLLVDSPTGGLPDAVPAGVRDVVRQRLAGVPAPTLAVLQVCALVGRVVDLRLLPRVTGTSVGASLAALEPAITARLLAEVGDGSGALHFAHALVREVVVEDLSGPRRLLAAPADRGRP